MPLLLVALAVTPPILLYETPKDPSARRQGLALWKGILHAGTVAAAVVAARFAIFDIIQFLSGARPEVGLSNRLRKAHLLIATSEAIWHHKLILVCWVAGAPSFAAPLQMKGGSKTSLPASLAPGGWNYKPVAWVWTDASPASGWKGVNYAYRPTPS